MLTEAHRHCMQGFGLSIESWAKQHLMRLLCRTASPELSQHVAVPVLGLNVEDFETSTRMRHVTGLVIAS